MQTQEKAVSARGPWWARTQWRSKETEALANLRLALLGDSLRTYKANIIIAWRLAGELTGSSKGVNVIAQQWNGNRLNPPPLRSLKPPPSVLHSVAVI